MEVQPGGPGGGGGADECRLALPGDKTLASVRTQAACSGSLPLPPLTGNQCFALVESHDPHFSSSQSHKPDLFS